jgi:folate-binding protein YgfZ
MREMSIALLASRSLVRVSGPDWRSFLQGLITQDVEDLPPGQARFAAMLTPQGKLLFDLFVYAEPDGEGALIDVEAERRAGFVQRLSMYRLRAKVEIAAVDESVLAAWGEEPPAPFTIDPRLPALGWRAFGSCATPDATEDDYDAHRLALGVPDPARDALADKTYPIEANFDLLGGIDFKKGCFVGQETTSRMKRRGQIKNRMLPISFDGPAPAFGAEVLAGTLRAGEVLTGRDGTAMALVRLDRIEGADLTVDGRPIRVERPAWVPAD